MEIKINGKALLALVSIGASLSFGKYVTLIDAESVGGIVVDGDSDEQIAEALLQITPIGSVIFRMDTVDPETIYGGTWELVTGASALKFGDGSPQTGGVDGSNIKNVPMLAHTHEMAHTHQRGSMEFHGDLSALGYASTSVGYSLNGSGAFHPSGSKTVIDKIDVGADQGSVYRSVNFYASRTWTGSTSNPYITNTGTAKQNTANSGVSGATLDVEGATIAINAWKRTN